MVAHKSYIKCRNDGSNLGKTNFSEKASFFKIGWPTTESRNNPCFTIGEAI